MSTESEPTFTLEEIEAAMVAVDVATDLMEGPITAEAWRQMVLDKLIYFKQPECEYCGRRPAQEYTRRHPPHDSVYCCDECYPHEKSWFERIEQ